MREIAHKIFRNHQDFSGPRGDHRRDLHNILRGSGVEGDARRRRAYEFHGGNVRMEGGANPSEYVHGRIRGSASLFFCRGVAGELWMFHASTPLAPLRPCNIR